MVSLALAFTSTAFLTTLPMHSVSSPPSVPNPGTIATPPTRGRCGCFRRPDRLLRRGGFAVAFVLGLSCGAEARAQAVAAVPNSTASAAVAATGEVVELSPFVTTAGSDKGYVATSSLAGSRVNTPLKDIAAQIDVMTLEFINDIGATNIEEAIAFSTNNGGANEQNTGASDGVTNTRASGRARGFDAITNSADFYATNLPSEFYNVERLTIANGPQSILFGLGNAGGAIDISTKRALMRNRHEVGFRVDNNGSLRATLDFNRTLIPQKLAVRLAAVNNDGKGYVEDAYNRQKRVFGTLTWKPLSGTTVRLSAEKMSQRASNASNYLAPDFLSPWLAAGSPLFDNSAGNAPITATAFPLLNRNSNALRVVSYGAGTPSVLIWNGSGLTRGPHQLAGMIDTRVGSITDNAIFPTDRDVRVGGRMNRLNGELVRAAVEQRITNDFFVELGFNYESVSELRGGPFDLAEAINIFADPNRYLPGGTATARQTALNPNAGRLYIESYPTGSEVRNLTKEVRLTSSYEVDFAKHFQNPVRHLGRHRVAGLVSWRVDEDRSQGTRAMVLGNPSFATGDLLNNSRFVRTRYYLDPASGNVTARALPGSNWFGPWTFTDSTRNESFQATMFDHPDGRESATGGSRKDIDTFMVALQSFFFKDRLNLFAGRRLDQFRSFLIHPSFLVRGDQLTPGDRRGLYTPLASTRFDTTATIDDEGTTASYGGVLHATRWLSVFASRSDNTALPPGFLDPNNKPLPGIFSNGYDYGFRVSLRQDAISLRVNFYKEHQHALIGDGQDVRVASGTIEQRLRGSDRPAGIADVPADGFDPVGRGVNAYRSVEDKIGRGVDVTLVSRITNNWDARIAVGQQKTRVFNKGLDSAAWVARRLPVWQSFGGLGWDRVAISTTDPRTVHQFYDEEVAAEIVRNQLRNNLPRFRQREWRASLFTNYRITEGRLKGLNFGGGVRWLDAPTSTGYYQRPFPNGSTGDDVTRPIPGNAQTAVDLLLGYSGRTKLFAGRSLGWRVQVNVRNLLDDDDIERLRSNFLGDGLQWGRVEPRQIILSTTFTF
jgi:outer membrane receptor protein involved in Fe transport